MQLPKSWVVSILVATFLSACATSPADRQREYEAAEKALAERKANRVFDVVSLESALLSAGGARLENDSVFPELRKTLLLKGERIGTLAPNYRNGQAAKWSSKFYQWCRKQGGDVELHANASKGPIGMLENGPVQKFAEALADLPTSIYRTDPNETEFCYDEEALRVLRKREPIASFTVLRRLEKSPAQAQGEGIAVVLTGKEIDEAERVARQAVEERRQRSARAQDETAMRVEKAYSLWEQASARLRDALRPGDRVAVVVQMDNKSYLSGGMVVEIKRPLASVQFSGEQGGLRWFDVSELRSPEVPAELRCSSLLAGRGCLY